MVKLPFRARRPVDASSGNNAEELACHYLKQQGLKIVERNYRTQRGEIDIIVRDGDTLVFVEVRLRSNPGFGGAAQSIDTRKQARLIKAAQHYLLTKDLTDAQPCRFDAVCLSRIQKQTPTNDSPPNNDSLEWIRDAFRPEA